MSGIELTNIHEFHEVYKEIIINIRANSCNSWTQINFYLTQNVIMRSRYQVYVII